MKKIICVAEKNLPLHTVKYPSGLSFRFLPGGDLYDIRNGDFMVNLYTGTVFDRSPANIYLRKFENGVLLSTPLLGKNSLSSFRTGARGVTATGVFRDLKYELHLACNEQDIWLWQIRVHNIGPRHAAFDAVYFQDIGLSAQEKIRTNEASVCHFLDHQVYNDPRLQYVICTRQNASQAGGGHPWLMSGCLDRATGFVTDGFQFYGLSSRATGCPEALLEENFPNVRRQYEFAAHGLKSRRFDIAPDNGAGCTFFSALKMDHPEATSEKDLSYVDKVRDFFRKADFVIFPSFPAPLLKDHVSDSPFFPSLDLGAEELDRFFPGPKRHRQSQGGKIQSFFYKVNHHVVLRDKELLTERPHGMILQSSPTIYPDMEIGSTTAWMCGVFNAHYAFGNTLYQRCLTIARGALNFQRSGGTRILVKNGSGWELLALPSAFEMGLDFCRWIYRAPGRTIEVYLYSVLRHSDFSIEIKVTEGGPCEFMIFSNVAFGGGEFEYEQRASCDPERGEFLVRPDTSTPVGKAYPNTVFRIRAGNPEAVAAAGFDEMLFADGISRNYPYLVFRSVPCADFGVTYTGRNDYRDLADEPFEYISYMDAHLQSDDFWQALRRHTEIEAENNVDFGRIVEVFPWFVQNAMVQFATPRGPEQPFIAYWRIRDICQGPFEMLLALRQYDVARRILVRIFEQQYLESGAWPQWFMFDQYYRSQQLESHGDIIIWPLKALCDYIEASNDLKILNEMLPCTRPDRSFTVDHEPLSRHVDMQLKHIAGQFMPGTRLLRYGSGDWNNALRPASAEFSDRLVSSWTVALHYQAIVRYAEVQKRIGEKERAREFKQLAAGIREDFNKYLLKDGAIAGFAYFKEDGGEPELFLHPSDETSGIKYRLLPFNRSVIGSLLTPEQAEEQLHAVREHLLCADGMHLTDTPTPYYGGPAHMFKHADAAAFFGREVGTHNTHAHLRYAEALSHLGRADDLMLALLQANPVKLQDTVPTALPRQSNAFFTSSDAAFNDRYEAMEGLDKLRDGRIGYRGGWRICSNGPGIFAHILISRMLGIRRYYDSLIVDPVLPESLGRVRLKQSFEDKSVTFEFERAATPAILVNAVPLEIKGYENNPYRRGGMIVDLAAFRALLNRPDNNTVTIHYQH
jgi:cellobiose phosphorylase